MKIKHVEELVGITRKNIRFYEEQGLLTPQRADNGYREYHAEDIERLKQIKFLRQLYVPLEEIRAVFAGSRSLESCLETQLREFDRRKASLDEMKLITEQILKERKKPGRELTLADLDIDDCLETVARMEKGGTEFMDVQTTDIHRKKTIGSLIGAGMMILLMVFVELALWWGNQMDPLPIPLLVTLLVIPALVMIGVIVVLAQRIREIRKGEEDEAAKY